MSVRFIGVHQRELMCARAEEPGRRQRDLVLEHRLRAADERDSAVGASEETALAAGHDPTPEYIGRDGVDGQEPARVAEWQSARHRRHLPRGRAAMRGIEL